MKIIKLLKLLGIALLLSFFSLYFATLGGYYESSINKKAILTEEAIQRFEQDVKEGKEIVSSNYIEPPKNYNNKAATLALKLSNAIGTLYDKTMKFIFKQLESAMSS